MTWWIRSQHPLWAVGIAIVVTIGVMASPDSFGLPIPSLGGPSAFASVRSYALAAVLITVGASASVSAGHKSAVLSATRPVRLYVLVFLSGIVGVCGLLAGASAAFLGVASTPTLLLVRDVLGLFGLGFLLVSRTGYRFAGIASTVYVFSSAIFGRAGNGDVALWAWPISDSTDLGLWIPAILLFIVGAVTMLLGFTGRFSRTMITQALDTRRE